MFLLREKLQKINEGLQINRGKFQSSRKFQNHVINDVKQISSNDFIRLPNYKIDWLIKTIWLPDYKWYFHTM